MPAAIPGRSAKLHKIQKHQKERNTGNGIYIIIQCLSVFRPDVELGKVATTYYARHSAATILKRSGASIAQIQEALGHSTQSVTQSYLDSFDDDTKKNLANSLSSFIKE